jgi:hypothetical protein
MTSERLQFPYVGKVNAARSSQVAYIFRWSLLPETIKMRRRTADVLVSFYQGISPLLLISESDTSYRKILAGKLDPRLLRLQRECRRCTVAPKHGCRIAGAIQNWPDVGQPNCPAQRLTGDCSLLRSLRAAARRMRRTRT